MFNLYFNSVNLEDDGMLPDFPYRTKVNTKLDTVEFAKEKIYRVIKKD